MSGERTPAEPTKVVKASRDEDIENPEITEPGDQDTPDPQAQPEDPRAAIYKKHDEQRDKQVAEDNKQFAQDNPEFNEDGTSKLVEGDKDNPESVDKAVDKSAAVDKIKDNDKEMIEIVVFGEPRMVPKEKVDKAGGIAAYQKEVAVMQGFKDISEQKKALKTKEEELNAREARVAEQEAALPTLDAQPAPKQETDPPQQGDQKTKVLNLIKQKNEALIDGDDDKAAELELEIIDLTSQATPQQQIDINKIKEEAADEATKKIDQRNHNNAVFKARNQLFADHPELKEDPRLFRAVDDETNFVVKDHPDYEPHEVLNEAWNRVQKWMGKSKPDSGNLDQKTAEKQSMNRPQASTGRATAPPPPRKNTRSDYVSQIQKARGQV